MNACGWRLLKARICCTRLRPRRLHHALAVDAVAPGSSGVRHARLHFGLPGGREFAHASRDEEVLALAKRSCKVQRPLDRLAPAEFGSRAGQHQRHARFVDQDVVGLVDDGHAQAAQKWSLGERLAQLDQACTRRIAFAADAVAQIVEHEFLRGAVGHVARVGVAPHLPFKVLRDGSDRQPEHPVHRLEPLRVPCDQIVVRGDHMDRNPGQRSARCRESHGKGLALSGGHLCKAALQNDARRCELGVERMHLDRPLEDDAEQPQRRGHGLRREALALQREANGPQGSVELSALQPAEGSRMLADRADRRSSCCTDPRRAAALDPFRVGAEQQARHRKRCEAAHSEGSKCLRKSCVARRSICRASGSVP